MRILILKRKELLNSGIIHNTGGTTWNSGAIELLEGNDGSLGCRIKHSRCIHLCTGITTEDLLEQGDITSSGSHGECTREEC
jgi:hypothetical protein